MAKKKTKKRPPRYIKGKRVDKDGKEISPFKPIGEGITRPKYDLSGDIKKPLPRGGASIPKKKKASGAAKAETSKLSPGKRALARARRRKK